MPVTVTNNTSVSLNSYQVKITINTAALISAGKMISTGDDIRFIDANSCNNLNYWIESGINTSNTVIWVKLNSLPSSAARVITMYYGNSAASSASNGDSTFILFDDFNGSSLNTSKWNTYTGGGSITQTGGQLYFSATSGIHNFATICSKSAFSVPLFVESLITSASGYYPSIAILNSNTFSGYALTYNDSNNNDEMLIFKATSKGGTFGGGQDIAQTNPGTLTGLWQLSWPSTNVQIGTWPGGTINSAMSYVTPSTTVNIAAGMLYSGVGSLTMDWIRARNYASSEATTAAGQEHNRAGIDNQYSDNSISIYPNPAHDEINIDLSSNSADLQSLQIIDMNGRCIKTIEIPGVKSNIAVSSQDFVKGLYIIRLTGKENTFVQKVLIQ